MKAEFKYVTIDENNKDYVALAKKIDFSELFNEIKKKLGVDCIFEQPEISTSYIGFDKGTVYISFQSNNIVSQTGILSTLIEECYINCSGKIVAHPKTKVLCFWAPVTISYGACITGIFRVQYYEDSSWGIYGIDYKGC
jgi:hypothetical protein